MADDSNSTIIDMLREQTRAQEQRSNDRHAEVLRAVGEIKTAFEAHEEKDDERFKDIDKWRNRMIGGGIVAMGVLSFATTVAAQMLGVAH